MKVKLSEFEMECVTFRSASTGLDHHPLVVASGLTHILNRDRGYQLQPDPSASIWVKPQVATGHHKSVIETCSSAGRSVAHSAPNSASK